MLIVSDSLTCGIELVRALRKNVVDLRSSLQRLSRPRVTVEAMKLGARCHQLAAIDDLVALVKLDCRRRSEGWR